MKLPTLSGLAGEIYRRELLSCRQGIDRLFAVVMGLQFVGLIATAWFYSPETWVGEQSWPHLHLVTAVVLGGALTLPSAAMAWWRPGRVATRYLVSASQLLVSALVIHLMGGRIEGHFHVFVSLAFVAAYRDLGALLIATVVAAVDHIVRGVWFPESIFGFETPAFWLALEHACWVVFEDVVLVVVLLQNLAMIRRAAVSEADIQSKSESLSHDIERLRARLDRAAAGDLSDSNEDDEIRELQELNATVDAMVSQLRGVVTDIRSGAEVVRSETSEANEVSTRVSGQMKQQQEAVGRIEQTIAQLNESIQRVRGGAERLVASAQESGQLAARGEEAVARSNTLVAKMEEESSKIQDCLADIVEIAEQTNLLALNATIEAARAGEAGKGFAVVAEEVKQLASRCNESAGTIEGMLRASSQAIADTVAQSHEVGDQLKQIFEGIEAVKSQVDEIAELADGQSLMASEVADATARVASASQESASGSESITTRCGGLLATSQRLEEKVGQFRF